MYDAIVVGLGIAGAMACRVLDRCELRILAIEAGANMGGRIQTEEFGDSIVELGAEWIHGTVNNPVYNYAMAHNIELKPQKLIHMIFASNGMIVNPTPLQGLWEYSFKLGNHNHALPLGQYLTQKITEYAELHMSELQENKSDYIEKFVRWFKLIIGVYESCDDWNEVSAQSNFKTLEGSPYVSWRKLGYKTLFDILFNLEKMTYVDAKFNTEVVHIKMPDEPSGPVTVTCHDGSIYHARSVIVTVSLGVLKEKHETLFEPRLPEQKVRAIEHLSIGVVNKVVLLFDKPWWPTELTCFAFFWRPDDLADIPESDMWVTKVFGATMTMGNDDCLSFWLSGQEAKLIETLPSDEVQGKLMWILRKFVGSFFAVPEPIDMRRSSWFRNPFTRGSYSYDNVNTPEFPLARDVLAEPVADDKGTSYVRKLRILFAGEATNKTHFSTVHGALDSGTREAYRFIKFECPDKDCSAYTNDPIPGIDKPASPKPNEGAL